MIQRHEVDFGFSSLGFQLSRYTYLKSGAPSFMSQMSIFTPPKRPYTSFEKLFQPFTIDAWLCIGLGYTIFAALTLLWVKVKIIAVCETMLHPMYTLWVLLMGGSTGTLRLNSSRIFVIGFVINTLIIRTLYQAAMFERLQASALLAPNLHTLSAINKAGYHYTMFRSTVEFYSQNPMIPRSKIKLIQNDSINMDELCYQLSQDRLDGVLALPFDIVAYYVKRNGKRGIVYVSKYTGFAYNTAFHYPKSTPLLESFDALIYQLHAAGLTQHWAEQYRDDRYWKNAKEQPEPSRLKWNQISGGFYLCGILLLLATLCFVAESMNGS
ncbi:uncharacterized protein LOC131207411 [Anopheles bellator]|uniref:uncharacterized protein LOC131207411 n=1 Tax=Anopheles bellator TaxID=139047 RepID=UPI0026470698|nr:uncharacterized protein LOC131207411 [Anopheles bellator]